MSERALAYVDYGDIGFGGVRVRVYPSRMNTVRQADAMSDRDIIAIYRQVTGDHQPITNVYPAYLVAKGQLDVDWHEINEVRVSESMAKNQERRVTKAAAEVNADNAEQVASAPKAPRKSIKNLICGRLQDQATDPSITDEQIAAEIREAFPSSKAAENPSQHIAYYRSQLGRNGTIPKRERAKKQPKAAAAGAQAGGTVEELEMAVEEA